VVVDEELPLYKRLGLPEFLFALDTPPEQLRKIVLDAISNNKESLGEERFQEVVEHTQSGVCSRPTDAGALVSAHRPSGSLLFGSGTTKCTTTKSS
jgi:hypothetical protein